MTFLSVLMITRTVARVEWTSVSVPVPLIHPEGCNLDKPGWVCDPDFWYTREEVNALADLLGPVDRVPPMAMVLLKPDNQGDHFGTLQYDSCDMKKLWTSFMKNATYPHPEMQLSLIKGKNFRVCPAGTENLSTTAKILNHDFDDLSRGLKQYLPALTKIVMEVREDLEVVRQWHHWESTLFSILAVASGIVVIFSQQMKRYPCKGSSVALPWRV